MFSITLPKPDDWHLHLRQGSVLKDTIKASEKTFARALVMPNLTPPLTTVSQIEQYEETIFSHTRTLKPYFSLYLTDQTSIETLEAATKHSSILGLKLYPQGATTNSSAGVSKIEKLYPLFEAMQALGLVLQVHGETTSGDIFNREEAFIETSLQGIHQTFPKLKIVLEHISTEAAVRFVLQSQDTVAATITIHHLLYNRNALLVGGLKPHVYCLPILKSEHNQRALQKAALSGNKKFFLGTDSAPHAIDKKESSCGCAGIFSAPYALQLYLDFFETHGALDKFEAFASHCGANFYGLAINQDTITLEKRPSHAAKSFPLGKSRVIPIAADEVLNWSLADD